MKLVKKAVIEALKKTNANISLAAKALGVARSSLYDFVNKHNDLKQLVTDERESLVDIAESALKSSVIKQEAWAVCFTLKTIGKHRGYVERVEQTGANGGAIQIQATDYRVAVKPLTTSDENS
jgi:transposase